VCECVCACVRARECVVCVCICSIRYTACKSQAPYCHLWSGPLYNILPHYIINGTTFGGGGGHLTDHKKCVLIFSTTFA